MQPTRDHAASPDLIEFGDSVKRLRMNASMSQRQFGAYVGLDQSSISRLERGHLPGLQLYRLMPILHLLGRLGRQATSRSQ